MAPPSQPKIEITLQGYWRGSQHTWQNAFWLSGGAITAADATTCINALKTTIGQVYPAVSSGSGVGFVEGKAYGPGGGAPIAEVAYNTSLAVATATGFAGPTSAYTSLGFGGTLENCLEIVTPAVGLSTRGKPVFLRKYIRGITPTNPEDFNTTPIAAADITKIVAAVASWQTGLGTTGRVVAGQEGRLPSAPPTVQKFIGNHQVPRGRKRSTSSRVGQAASSGLALGTYLGAKGTLSESAPLSGINPNTLIQDAGSIAELFG